MKYAKVDSYGDILRNRELPEVDCGRDTRLATLARYKFTLAFENSIAPDYVTEKFFDPLIAGSVPVYLGAPNVSDFAPADRCFINVADFSSPAALAAHLNILIQDAEAYARWAGKTLPSEAEWEYAARGGLDGAEFAWGDEFTPNNRYMANTWQGSFPHQNSRADGYARTSPVTAFPPNGYGLYDMIGNVWEWTTDWFSPRHPADEAKACCIPENPRGGLKADSFDPRDLSSKIPRKVVKGGSHLCAPNYCRRYRPAARHAQPIDTGMGHVGFRCVVRS
jgi:hypothetical protein